MTASKNKKSERKNKENRGGRESKTKDSTLEEGSWLSTKTLIRRILVSSISLPFLAPCSSTLSLDSIMLEFIIFNFPLLSISYISHYLSLVIKRNIFLTIYLKMKGKLKSNGVSDGPIILSTSSYILGYHSMLN